MIADVLRATRRHVEFGPGSLARLGSVLDGLDRGPVVLLGSAKMDYDQRTVLETAAGRPFDAHLATPSELDAQSLASLSAALTPLNAAIVVGCGGGTVMDAAKALTRPGSTRLVLIPKTLSGSEHTANTSHWENNHKIVTSVGMADAVVADPALLLSDLAILGPGGLHAAAHALATLRDARAGEFAQRIARAALMDLVTALLEESPPALNRVRFMRGAWMAAVGFGLTGPRIGVHHELVHALADRGQHGRFSAHLLCAALVRTDFHKEVLVQLDDHIPGLGSKLLSVAATWLPRVAAAEPRSTVPGWSLSTLSPQAGSLLRAIARD